jgi:ferritin-like metal-binding protein YciE
MTMMNDQLIAWLNDAYAMEQGLIPVLQSHAGDAQGLMPQAASRMQQHIVETQTHAARVEQCLRTLGATPSTVKSTLSQLMGSVEGLATGIFSDAPVKNVLADYSAEQLEVACYRALITAARNLGHENIAQLCEMNLQEDEAMALWLRDQIPEVVTSTMRRAGV